MNQYVSSFRSRLGKSLLALPLALVLGLLPTGPTLAQTPATFGRVVAYKMGMSFPGSIAVADVNGDGKLDVLTANFRSDNVGVLLGNGRGSFALQTNLPGTGEGNNPKCVAVADVNGDGKPDVLTANTGSDNVGVLLGDGRGGFTLQANPPGTGGGSKPRCVAVADVNCDRRPDVLATTHDFTVAVLLGNGRAGFTLQANAPSTGEYSGAFDLQVVDVNNNGKADVLTANFTGREV